MSKPLVPMHRFPGFTHEWQVKKIGDFVKTLNAGVSVNSVDRPSYSTEKGVLKTSCVTGGSFDATKNKAVIYDYELKRLREPVVKDSVLISRMNTPGLVGANALVNKDYPNLYLPDRLWAARFASNGDPRWFAFLLGSNKLRTSLSTVATGTSNSMKNITKSDVLSMAIRVPELPEQEKIAEFLTVIDEKITKLDKKLTSLELYMHSMMQQIFSRKICFTDVDHFKYPQWAMKKLGDLGVTYTGLMGKGAEDFGVGRPYITYMQIFGNSKIGNNFGQVNINVSEKQNRVKKGDVFFTISSETPSETGYVSVLLDDYKELYLNSFCFGYRPNPTDLLPEFARYLFHSTYVRKSIIRLAQGSTRYNISKNEVMKLSFYFPDFSEQNKIANFLDSIDKKITVSRTSLKNMTEFKKSLMQKMFL